MIYFFHGTDSEKVRAKAFEWIAKARAKEPNLAYVRLAREDLSGAALEDVAHSGGLFVRRLLVLIDDPFQLINTSCLSKEVIDDHLDAFAESGNAIIVLAPNLPSVRAKKLAAKAAKTYVFDLPPRRETSRGFNSALVNALAARSREKLWLEVVRAIRAGDPPEMLHGLLHWKARDLMDLPAGRQGRGNWSAAETRQLSFALIELLQSSRRGGPRLAHSLERFALSI